MNNLPPRRTCRVLLSVFLLFGGLSSAHATIHNVKTECGAAGNGTTDDTAAINACIGQLASGDTLLFPAGTYKVTGALNINVANVTVDGSSNTATLSFQASGAQLHFGPCAGIGCAQGTASALSATANELATSFTTASSIGATAGSYIYLTEGGVDYNTTNLSCNVSGCRGEVVKIASVSGNTYTVTTALHDAYVPTSGGTMASHFVSSGCNLGSGSGNCATAFILNNPLKGITLQNITLDGTNVSHVPLMLNGVGESTISGVTIARSNSYENNGTYTVLANLTFGLTVTNVTITSGTASRAQWGMYQAGSPTINGLTVSGPSGGAAFFSSVGAASVTNMTVDDNGSTVGRPFKTTSTRYSIFTNLTERNGAAAFNGVSIEYYTGHTTLSNCSVTNNAAGPGSGGAGLNSFGDHNDFNTYSGCTFSGNGNVEVFISNATGAFDTNNTLTGNTISGNVGGQSPIGILLYGANHCINNNIFTSSTGLSSAISVNSTNTLGAGNTLNGFSSNLTSGTCSGGGGSGAPAAPSGLVATVQ